MEGELTRGNTIVMAICTGLVVANIYYCQPLVILMAKEFHISEAYAGRVNYLTQAGYALGLFLLVPLGDMLERRRQILFTTVLSIAALLLAAFAHSFWLLQVACFLIGACSIIPQLILPLAASLSNDGNRGKNIGMVMSGLLVGILVSRAVSGSIGFWLGWRAVYMMAAGICVLLIVIMAYRFPKSKPGFAGNYAMLMHSMLAYIKSQRQLRETAAINFVAFAIISGFWTVMVLHLASPVYNYQTLQIGLFGIVGAAGALTAPVVGKLSDGGNPRKNLLRGFVLQLVSLGMFYFFGGNIFIFVIGIIFIDIAQQAIHVTNQTRIYTLIPEARNRLNTIFMSVSFIGAALGSALGLALWKQGGWDGFCAGCVILVVVEVVLFMAYKTKAENITQY